MQRTHIYNVFSQLARPPMESAGKLAHGWEQESLLALKQCEEEVDFDLRGLEELLTLYRHTDPLDMERHYCELFGEEEQELHIPIQEEIDEAIPVGARDEIQRIYDYFGYRPFEYGGRSADHLSVELGFMKVLAMREMLSDAESRISYALTQRDFLERHMLRWFPSAAEKVEKAAQDDFYPKLFRQLVTFLTRDAKWRRESLALKDTA
ncbi:MAG: molecular chaperone TorD family protein [Gammaproteobacteria bacterium]|nr:molecular chaperone TorD family protein [Gammaproteobacteria bacterium]